MHDYLLPRGKIYEPSTSADPCPIDSDRPDLIRSEISSHNVCSRSLDATTVYAISYLRARTELRSSGYIQAESRSGRCSWLLLLFPPIYLFFTTRSDMSKSVWQKFWPTDSPSSEQHGSATDSIEPETEHAHQLDSKSPGTVTEQPLSVETPNEAAQDGVTAAEAITLTWTKKSLAAAYIL